MGNYCINLGGEDGQVRIWARSGMLRSNLVQAGMLYTNIEASVVSSDQIAVFWNRTDPVYGLLISAVFC